MESSFTRMINMRPQLQLPDIGPTPDSYYMYLDLSIDNEDQEEVSTFIAEYCLQSFSSPLSFRGVVDDMISWTFNVFGAPTSIREAAQCDDAQE
ncbi:hypothetical protein HK096_010134 [Nowakowskiella sp. JEL0078]|nr:hypothetical protein HK096_010134 [Nowakowskiella sp. JEL0078]